MTRNAFVITLCVVASLTGPACGKGGSHASAVKPPRAHFTGFYKGVYFQDGKIADQAPDPRQVEEGEAANESGSGGAKHSTATTQRTPTTFLQQDFVKVNVDESYGYGCHLRAGDSCQIPLQGIAYLGTQAKGKLVLQVFEDSGALPVGSRELSPINQGRTILCEGANCPFGGALLPYTPSKGARTWQVHVVIETPEGVPLATGKTDTYAVTT